MSGIGLHPNSANVMDSESQFGIIAEKASASEGIRIEL